MRKAILISTLIIPLVVPPPARAQTHTDRTIAVGQQTRLELSCEKGSIHIRTWDRPSIHLRVMHDPATRIEVETGVRVVSVHAITPHNKKDAPVAYTVTVPVNMDLELSAVEAPIHVRNSGGRVEANNVRGPVDVRGGTNTVAASSVEGGVTIIGARGGIEATTVNAGVFISDVTGRVEATTVNGGVRLTDVNSRSVEATTVNGEVRYEGAIHNDGVYSFSSHNGPLNITVPQGTNASVSVSTFSGAFSAGFPVSFRQVHGDKSFKFELGTGGARLNLESFNGTIRLRRPGER